MNSGDYNIEAENACASLLSQFNSNFIFDICSRTLDVKDAPAIRDAPNIVSAAEMNFNDLISQFPADIENIKTVRSLTFLEIIDRLCSYYDATFVDPGEEYHFVLARDMYYFLACGYCRCLIKFMAWAVYKHADELYTVIYGNGTNKNKDTATIYNKRMFKNNPKLGMVLVNLKQALNYILGMDFSFHEILKFTMIQDEIVYLCENSFKFHQDFYNYYKATMANEYYRPLIESNISFHIQSHYLNHDLYLT